MSIKTELVDCSDYDYSDFIFLRSDCLSELNHRIGVAIQDIMSSDSSMTLLLHSDINFETPEEFIEDSAATLIFSMYDDAFLEEHAVKVPLIDLVKDFIGTSQYTDCPELEISKLILEFEKAISLLKEKQKMTG